MDKAHEGHEVNPCGGKRLHLKIAGRAIGHHRRAILHEAKLYTWWLLTIGIVLMFLGTSVSTSFYMRAVIILVGCIGGAVLALIGLGVMRREAELLDKSLEVYDRLAGELDIEQGATAIEGEANKGLGTLLSGVLGSKKTKMETWDWFQATFILAAAFYFVAFVGVLVYTILA